MGVGIALIRDFRDRASFVKRVKKFSLIVFLFLSGFYKELGPKRKGKPGALLYTLRGFDAVRFLLFFFARHEVPSHPQE